MIYFLIPAYNEEKNIPKLIAETDAFMRSRGMDYQMTVVDDGSSDATAKVVNECAQKYPIHLISYKPNQGVAQAFRTGFNHLLTVAGEKDLIVSMEADRTGDLEILQKMLSLVTSGNADVALASCYAKGGKIENTTALRIFLSRCANSLIQVAFNMREVHTYSSFYRVYKPSTLKKVLTAYGDYYEETGFACVVELLVRIKRLNLKLAEVPMILRSEKRIGKSKMKIMPTILGYFRVISRNARKKVTA